MKKKLFSLILVFTLCFTSVFALAPVASAAGWTDALGPINDVLSSGKTMIDIAGTVAITGAEVAARTSERRYYDTLTAMAQGGSGVFAARGGGTNYTSIIDASTTSINYIDTSTNQYTTNNYNEIYYNSIYNTYYATTNNYDYYITYAPTYTYVTYVGTTAEWDSRQSVVYYFELPDGRNSYDLTAADVYGMVFDYDVKNYNSVVEDDGKTLGLYHFDGDVFDSSANKNNVVWNTGSSVTYMDGNVFNAGLYLDSSAHKFTVPTNVGSGDFTLEFRFYVAPVTTKQYSVVGSIYNAGYFYKQVHTQVYHDSQYSHLNKTDTVYSYYSSLQDTNPQTTSNDWFSSTVETSLEHSSKRLLFYNASKFSIAYDGVLQDVGSTCSYPEIEAFGYSHDSFDSSLLSLYEKKSLSIFGFFDLGYRADLSCGTADNLNQQLMFANNTYSVRDECLANFSGTGVLSYVKSGSLANFPVGQWVSCSAVRMNGVLNTYINGVRVSTVPDATAYSEFVFDMASGAFQYSYIDELRVSKGALYSGDSYDVPTAPFDTNDVLVLPDKVKNKTVYIQSSEEISDYRIGGVRPTYPVKGSVFVGLTSEYKVESIQQYNGSEWTLVRGAVGVDGTAQNLTGYSFATAAVTPDTYPDPDNPGGSSGGGTTDPDDPGGGSTDTGSTFWEKLGKFFKGIGEGIGGLFSGLFDGILALFNTVLSLFQSLKGFGTGFVSLLSAMMPFIPSEIIAILTAGVGVSVILFILKIFRK